MKTLNQVLLITCLSIFLSSCQGDRLTPIDETSKISMEIERTNSNDDFSSEIKEAAVNEKSARWRKNANGTIQLVREVSFDLTLGSGQNVPFGFWFIKREADKNLLILEDENSDPDQGGNWDYISSEMEASDFYQGFDEARVLIDANVNFHTENNENFNITKIKTINIDGEEKSQLTIEYSGKVYGLYDPEGKFSSIYELSNGTFKGVIE